MARVRDVEMAELPAEIQPVYQRFATEYGPFLNQVKVFAHRPPAVKHLMGLLLTLADEQILPKRYLEIALVAVSKINACHYCVVHHTPRAIEQGLSAEAVAGILEPQVEGFDEVDMLVRDFAVQVTNNAATMRDQIFDDLKKHFTEEQIVELTLRTALCGFFNRFNDALQIGMEDGALADMLAHGASEDSLPKHTTAAE